MRVSDFSFDLPSELIARFPMAERTGSRLMTLDGNSGEVTDLGFKDILAHLNAGDLLVFNNTRVIPAQLTGKKNLATIHLTLHKKMGNGHWRAFAKPAKKLSQGDHIDFSEDFSCRLVHKLDNGEVEIAFNATGDVFDRLLAQYGSMPLPPYMKRKATEDDQATYQTVYAKEAGAVAAPTAGLHFTQPLQTELGKRGVEQHYVTLHVGAGTFLPVKTDNVTDHVMHSEYCYITPEVAAAINRAKTEGRRVIAVGTTSLRTLESMTNDAGILQSGDVDTNIFITPGYHFKMIDGMITNFHLPRSTLFMLVSAFMGLDVMQSAYAHAIDKKYRFYSYGDACFLEKKRV